MSLLSIVGQLFYGKFFIFFFFSLKSNQIKYKQFLMKLTPLHVLSPHCAFLNFYFLHFMAFAVIFYWYSIGSFWVHWSTEGMQFYSPFIYWTTFSLNQVIGGRVSSDVVLALFLKLYVKCHMGRWSLTFLIIWAAACHPREPMCLLKEMLRCVADS